MSNDTTILTEKMEDAIEFCAKKTNLEGRAQVANARARGDCAVCEYLRYGLAKGVAEYLGSLDETIKAIYVYDPESATQDGSALAQPSFSPGISMVIWVARKTAALSSLVTSAKMAVDEELWRLPCPDANALCHILDAVIVDDQEVLERTGYGALLGSFYVRPTEIWHR